MGFLSPLVRSTFTSLMMMSSALSRLLPLAAMMSAAVGDTHLHSQALHTCHSHQHMCRSNTLYCTPSICLPKS